MAERVAAVSALDEPIRRALLDYVSRSEAPVSRDDVAEAFGLARSTAVFHLDRLAEAGLLAVAFRRLAGRTGPGQGGRRSSTPRLPARSRSPSRNAGTTSPAICYWTRSRSRRAPVQR